MGSEQSHPQQQPSSSTTTRQQSFGQSSLNSRPGSSGIQRLQRGNTIATSGQNSKFTDNSPTDASSDSRPVSPPMSVCSDSDLPYISYTDKPIGGSYQDYVINFHYFQLNYFSHIRFTKAA